MLVGQRRAGETGDAELSGQIVKGVCGGRALGTALLVSGMRLASGIQGHGVVGIHAEIRVRMMVWCGEQQGPEY